jgi:DNA repair protein RadC
VHPREVLGPALREGAAGVILAHGHPSGDPTPSPDDTRLTHQLRDAAALLEGRGGGAVISFTTLGRRKCQHRFESRHASRS